MVSPERRRAAVAYLVRRHKVSERRACRLVGQNRSTQRYEHLPTDEEERLVRAMSEIAAAHPRYGYRLVCAVLRQQGWKVNHKRIERLWRLEDHRVPPTRLKDSGKKATGGSENAVWTRRATAANHVWSYDFMSARTRRGGPIRILNIVDEFTRVALAAHASRSIGAVDLIKILGETFDRYGKPSVIRSDNGREFIATTVVEWLAAQGVETAFIQRGRPQQNAYVERFNGTMRRELLNAEDFDTLLEARVMIEGWWTSTTQDDRTGAWE